MAEQEEKAFPIKAVQAMGLNSLGQSIPLRLPAGVQAQRVDEFAQLVGLNSQNLPVLLRLNDDGTLAVTPANFPAQAAHVVFSGPASGPDAAPTFRALVPADFGTGTPSKGTFLRGDGIWTGVLSSPLSPAGPSLVYIALLPNSGVTTGYIGAGRGGSWCCWLQRWGYVSPR